MMSWNLSVVTAHMVYFRAFTPPEIFQKHTRQLGVGHGQFYPGINGLICNIMKVTECSEQNKHFTLSLKQLQLNLKATSRISNMPGDHRNRSLETHSNRYNTLIFQTQVITVVTYNIVDRLDLVQSLTKLSTMLKHRGQNILIMSIMSLAANRS